MIFQLPRRGSRRVGEEVKEGWDFNQHHDSLSPAWRWRAWPGWPDAARWGRPAGRPWLFAVSGSVRCAVWALRGVTSAQWETVTEKLCTFITAVNICSNNLCSYILQVQHDCAPSKPAQSQRRTSEHVLPVIPVNGRSKLKQNRPKSWIWFGRRSRRL